MTVHSLLAIPAVAWQFCLKGWGRARDIVSVNCSATLGVLLVPVDLSILSYGVLLLSGQMMLPAWKLGWLKCYHELMPQRLMEMMDFCRSPILELSQGFYFPPSSGGPFTGCRDRDKDNRKARDITWYCKASTSSFGGRQLLMSSFRASRRRSIGVERR